MPKTKCSNVPPFCQLSKHWPRPPSVPERLCQINPWNIWADLLQTQKTWQRQWNSDARCLTILALSSDFSPVGWFIKAFSISSSLSLYRMVTALSFTFSSSTSASWSWQPKAWRPSPWFLRHVCLTCFPSWCLRRLTYTSWAPSCISTLSSSARRRARRVRRKWTDRCPGQ